MALGRIAESYGWAKTGMLCGDPVGAAGVAIRREHASQKIGTGEVWALFSPVIKTLPKALYKATALGLAEVKRETGVMDMWALCLPGDQAAARFLEHLGFTLEFHRYGWHRGSDD